MIFFSHKKDLLTWETTQYKWQKKKYTFPTIIDEGLL